MFASFPDCIIYDLRIVWKEILWLEIVIIHKTISFILKFWNIWLNDLVKYDNLSPGNVKNSDEHKDHYCSNCK